MTPKRAAVYIDGFNLYHAIEHLSDKALRWLSLADLARMIIRRRTEEIANIVYFTAVASHPGPATQQRQLTYISALRATGIDVVLGRFKQREQHCRNCNARWRSHEEKETDVNIAVRIVRDGFKNVFDACYIISGDTDLIPAIRALKADLPEKEIVGVLPPRRRHGRQILDAAHRSIRLNENHLQACRLPEELEHKDKHIRCPEPWRLK